MLGANGLDEFNRERIDLLNREPTAGWNHVANAATLAALWRHQMLTKRSMQTGARGLIVVLALSQACVLGSPRAPADLLRRGQP